jgi:hypothetical protein
LRADCNSWAAAPIAAPSFFRVIGRHDFSLACGPQSCALRQPALEAEARLFRNLALHRSLAITQSQADRITDLKIATRGHDWCNGCVGNAMATKIVPSLETVERLIVEVEQWYERVRKIRPKMTCVERGSD